MTPSDPAGAGAPPLDIAPEEFRRLGERLLAALEDYRRRLPERPARPVEPEETVRLVLNQALPETGADPDAIVDFLVENILPYSLGNDHPRFFAWITAPGSPIGALADLAATATNTVTGGPPRVHAGLERCVTRWLMELAGFPTDGSYGLLVSGGTVANLTIAGGHMMGPVGTVFNFREGEACRGGPCFFRGAERARARHRGDRGDRQGAFHHLAAMITLVDHIAQGLGLGQVDRDLFRQVISLALVGRLGHQTPDLSRHALPSLNSIAHRNRRSRQRGH